MQRVILVGLNDDALLFGVETQNVLNDPCTAGELTQQLPILII